MKTMNEENVVIPLISGEDISIKDASAFQKIIGQESAKNQLTFYVQSHSNSTAFPTLLFNGSHGLGKSFFASKVAEALGRELIEVNCANVIDAKNFMESVIIERVIGDKPKTLLLDEAQELPQDVETVLLSFLNPNEKGYNDVSYKNLKFRYDFRKINVILATTDSYKMSKPLINRCSEIYFKPYDNKDLLNIIASYMPGISIKCDKNEVAYSGRGRARDAFFLAQNIKRYCAMKNTNVLDRNGWQDIKSVFGIYQNGLRNEEITLMKMLLKERAMSAKNIAIRMGVGVMNVEAELEVRPKELGFVSSGARGRFLTEEGIKYLEKLEKV